MAHSAALYSSLSIQISLIFIFFITSSTLLPVFPLSVTPFYHYLSTFLSFFAPFTLSHTHSHSSLSPSALPHLRYDAVFAALRDCYEAYAVYTFIALLIAILEDGKGLPQLLNKVSELIVCAYCVCLQCVVGGVCAHCVWLLCALIVCGVWYEVHMLTTCGYCVWCVVTTCQRIMRMQVMGSMTIRNAQHLKCAHCTHPAIFLLCNHLTISEHSITS